jgi:hypothetical protein
MKFDKGDRTFDKELFEYVEDPTIESAESGVAGQVSHNKITHNISECSILNAHIIEGQI